MSKITQRQALSQKKEKVRAEENRKETEDRKTDTIYDMLAHFHSWLLQYVQYAVLKYTAPLTCTITRLSRHSHDRLAYLTIHVPSNCYAPPPRPSLN